jgi:hypothetical protein
MVREGGDDSERKVEMNVQSSNKDDAVDLFRALDASSGNCNREDTAFCE